MAPQKLLPPPVAPGPVIQHDGPVMQLSGKGLLVPGSWKRRYCVLDGRRLYYYQLNGENQGHLHYRDKTSHYVDLDNYDICEEAKGIKTASNVLVISSSEIEKSFFDTGRLYLSAETAKEMNEWISQIRSAMSALRNGPAKAQPPPKSSSKSAAADVSTCSTAEQAAKMNTTETGLETSILLLNPGEHLDCITKQRAKGPTGRRLPRQAKSRLYPASDAVQQQQRSESLPRLEPAVNNDPVNIRSSQLSRGHLNQQQHNRSFDTGQHHQNKRAAAYAYSSSEESLNLSFAQQPPDQQQQQDEETVETLCEIPLIHHSTSTPSLVAHPSFGQMVANNHWLNIGSSSSTPRPVTSGKRRSVQPYSCTSTDDPPGLPHQYQLLLQQTAAIKTTLSGLEADFGASRRDMGWLQENLTTVQSATGSVSDKVVKMQSQVANMERQINGAVKEAQQLQQRANDALKSASDAERDFRRLENDCQSLLNQLLRQQQSSNSLADPLCLSPMTPHPPGSLMMMSFQQQQQQHGADTSGHHFCSQRSSSQLPPLAPVPQLNIPPTFDFAALLTKSMPIGSSAVAAAEPRMKSSFRSEGVNKNGTKSISFGPITTYATSPTTDPDDVIPAATSTLRKTISHSSGPSFVLPVSDFNQNSPHSMMTS
ncbi:uncharacterized protein LOC124190492 isoform X4 [Daphnia pulex]|uniref:uncharacterized protein LOC124190492 isoform X4 n=1 Tax=Daphnia pulex TaxID=6669 RepID=UPI001EDCBB92|nr:uncharacterized protein LOC124190492 isoform X4 [Daphnia pulex]